MSNNRVRSLSDWLNSRAKYAEELSDNDLSEYNLSRFGGVYSRDNNMYEPNDIDMKMRSFSSIDGELTSDTSDLVEDMEVKFMPGSNHCAVNIMYKNLMNELNGFDCEVPIIKAGKNNTIEYSSRFMDTEVDKREFYKILMKMSR